MKNAKSNPFSRLAFTFCILQFAICILYCLPVSATEAKPQQYRPLYTLKIDNSVGGKISAQYSGQDTWEELGSVISIATTVNDNTFSASRWGKPGAVIASAVNALHLSIGLNPTGDRGVLLSILPKDALDKNTNSYLDMPSSIVTDIKPGKGIFGGHYTPFPGNLFLVIRDGDAITLDVTYRPAPGDQIMIAVRLPEPYPEWVSFENKFGGVIRAKFPELATPVTVGEVLRPATGVGRFVGTQFASRGRIRAVHPGVIDVATSWKGNIGGFQIIPAEHAMDSEMIRARTMSQWMVVGPTQLGADDLAGRSPLFLDYICPRYDESDLSQDNWGIKVLDRFQVLAKTAENDDDALLPEKTYGLDKELPKEAMADLNELIEIKIVFPLIKTP